jgi:3-hydroxymyristoyl/3-hydroxydecanoyl-(acyl carrier protein) dehydratase
MMQEPNYSPIEIGSVVAEWDITITPDIEYFNGHFPEQPILPGVVQTQWAILFAKKAWAVEVNCLFLKQVKFKELILPESRIKLHLELKEAKQQLVFKYLNINGSELSSGIIESVTLSTNV